MEEKRIVNLTNLEMEPVNKDEWTQPDFTKMEMGETLSGGVSGSDGPTLS